VTVFLFKLLMTPIFIGAVTLAGRRWGPAVSGLLMGLPLTSGPVSVFLALQFGPAFAARAAVGNLAGQASGCAFCLTYGLAARKWPWTVCVPVSLLVFLGCTALLDRFTWSLLSAGILLLAAIILAHRWLPRRPCAAVRSSPPRWDLPARMLVATAFVLALTSCARFLGPQMSGLIAPFPVFGLVLAAFTHRRQGPAAVAGLLRGNVLGSLAVIAFFLVAGGGLASRAPLPAVYLLAALAATLTSGAALLASRGRHPGSMASGTSWP
jgi:F0F1-type ATP synthase assembly protein I